MLEQPCSLSLAFFRLGRQDNAQDVIAEQESDHGSPLNELNAVAAATTWAIVPMATSHLLLRGT